MRKRTDRSPVTSLVDYQGFCGFSANTANAVAAADDVEKEEEEVAEVEEGFRRVSPQEVVGKMRAGWAPFVLDVRYVAPGQDARSGVASGNFVLVFPKHCNSR